MSAQKNLPENTDSGQLDLFDLSVTGLLLISTDGAIRKANRAAREMFGSSAVRNGTAIQKIFHDDSASSLSEILKRLLKKKSFQISHLLMLDANKGNVFWANMHFSLIDDTSSGQPFFLCQIQNISDLKKATDEALYHNYLLNELINSIPDNVFIKDAQSRFLLANRSVAEVMGAFSPEELIGKTDFNFYPDKLARKYRNDELEVMKSGKAKLNIIELIIDRDKQKRWYSTSKIPLISSNGDIIGIMGIGRDLTDFVEEKKDMHKAKLAAERADRLKSAFLANLSHEVRTPLNGILGFSQFLKKSLSDDPKTSKYLDYIIQNGKRLLYLISDIVDLSKIECHQLILNNKEFSVLELMRKLERSAHIMLEEENKKNITLCLDIKPKDENIILHNDDQRIEQILHNLLSNAVKFTEQGDITFGYCSNNGKLEFMVKDTGIGIEDENQKQIFESFVQVDNTLTRQYEGAGLGLTIAKGLCKLLKGEIYLKSAPGKGSEFIFTIPYKKISSRQVR
jgi:PAS domain S-box-containing protein